MKHKRSLISSAMAIIVLVSLCAVCATTSVGAATSSSKASVRFGLRLTEGDEPTRA